MRAQMTQNADITTTQQGKERKTTETESVQYLGSGHRKTQTDRPKQNIRIQKHSNNEEHDI